MAEAPHGNLRLWNVELDAEEDRAALQSPIAVTGVNHLYGLLERLTFGVFDPNRLSVTRQNLWKSTKLDYPIARLGMRDEIPDEVQQTARRKSVSAEHSETTEAIVKRFESRIGSLIVTALEGFAPYSANNQAAMSHHDSLSGIDGEFIRTIMYEGQSQSSTFQNFFESLNAEFRDEVAYVPTTHYQTVQKKFKTRHQDLLSERRKFIQLRLQAWLGSGAKKWALNEPIANSLNATYSTLVTAAFQNALLLTFFHAVFAIDDTRRSASPPKTELTDSGD